MAVLPTPPLNVHHHVDVTGMCSAVSWFTNLEHMLVAAGVGLVLGVLGMLWYKRAGSTKAMVTETKVDIKTLLDKLHGSNPIPTPTVPPATTPVAVA